MTDGQEVFMCIVSAALLCSDRFIFYNDFSCSDEFCFSFVSLFFDCIRSSHFCFHGWKTVTISTHKISKYENPQSLSFYSIL
jgi:hypothetical protein